MGEKGWSGDNYKGDDGSSVVDLSLLFILGKEAYEFNAYY